MSGGLEAPAFVLTVEAEPDRVVVYADPAGLRHLVSRLERLLETAGPGGDHDHLMTPDWGGTDLTSAPGGGGPVVHHVKVYCDPRLAGPTGTGGGPGRSPGA